MIILKTQSSRCRECKKICCTCMLM